MLKFFKTFQKNVNLFLYFAAITVNITSFTVGVAFAWSSPVTPKLKAIAENPLGYQLTEEEISWLASLLSLGSVIGPFAGGYLADKIGRKNTLLLSTVPLILCFLILAFLHYLYLYYVARFILGACIGIYLTTVPMFIGEIAEIHNRGTLGCFTILSVTMGFLFSFGVGPFISIQWFNVSCIILPIIFLILYSIFIPETPSYLIMKDRHEEARKSLIKYRKGDVRKEMVDIEATVKNSLTSRGGILDIWKTRYLFRSLCVSMGLMMIQQLTASTAITFYLQMIFDSAGSSIPPEFSAIIVGAMEVIGAFISSTIVDKLGRRPLLLVSTISTTVCLLILSIYFYLLVSIDVTSINWIPLVVLIVFTLLYGIGIGSLPQTLLSELFPTHVKSIASSLTICSCFTFSFAVAKIFPLLTAWIDNWFAFLIFAIGNAGGIVFIYFRVPETKGKTLLEIMESFK